MPICRRTLYVNLDLFDLPLFHAEVDAVIVRDISCKEVERNFFQISEMEALFKTVCG